eukprot:Platyproteum_vivax@DN4138_c0_g1_i1.p1
MYSFVMLTGLYSCLDKHSLSPPPPKTSDGTNNNDSPLGLRIRAKFIVNMPSRSPTWLPLLAYEHKRFVDLVSPPVEAKEEFTTRKHEAKILQPQTAPKGRDELPKAEVALRKINQRLKPRDALSPMENNSLSTSKESYNSIY